MATTTTTTNGSTVWKRTCTCKGGPAGWPKCPCPWYLKQFVWGGKPYAMNLTVHAQTFLNEALTTKTRAEAIAEAVRASIRAGTYVSAKAQRKARPVVVTAGLTLDTVIARFDKAIITADAEKRDTTKAGDRACLAKFAAFTPPKHPTTLGAGDIAALCIEDVLAFRTSPPIKRLTASSWTKYRNAITALLRWAKAEGLAPSDVFADARPDHARLLRRGKSARRTRRVTEDEEGRLLRAAGHVHDETTATRLQGLIIAAIETGLRLGELLALVWGDVDVDARTVTVRAEDIGASKTGASRVVPMSTRLRDELRTLRTDPNGEPWPRGARVFGNAVGEPIRSIKKAWQTAVLRAHGVGPTWTATGGLAVACQARWRTIDLHFHDLRHEAGCRWLESRVFDLEQIRQMYGHATVAQTAHYLHAAGQSARTAMDAYDAARTQRAAVAANGDDNPPTATQRPHKRPSRRGGDAGPRLVKGRNTRDAV